MIVIALLASLGNEAEVSCCHLVLEVLLMAPVCHMFGILIFYLHHTQLAAHTYQVWHGVAYLNIFTLLVQPTNAKKTTGEQ